MSVMRWLKLGLSSALPVTSDQRGIVTIEVGADGAADQLVVVLRDASGNYVKCPLAPVALTTQAEGFVNVTADAADTPITPNLSTFVQAYSQAVTLPPGTWTVWANGWLGLKNSGGNSGMLRLQIDGTAGGTRTVSLNATTYQTAMCHRVASGVSGGRDITVLMEYHGVTSGTTSAQNPALWIAVQRSA